MSRRTKQELAKAEERRLKRVKKQLKKSKSSQKNKPNFTQSQLESESVPVLFRRTFGYDFTLVKKDLTRTALVSALVGLILLGIVLYF